jgi:hypothetical protein
VETIFSFKFDFVPRLSEAESLFPADWNRVGGNNSDDELVSQFGDSASFALQILAKIFAASERSSQVSPRSSLVAREEIASLG